ncbi:MAG: Nif3-like dinuclear metal center hexameric protein [Chromatiales bacterium]|nr:Nif3-like dinuclear metal center hexameric protein [Chromatiales bacterium]
MSELVAYTDRLLAIESFSDYCPNGLQVQGRPEVRTLVGGVTACQALLDAAVERQADAVLVHHGYFWKGEDPCIVGMKQRRLATLLRHEISLLAYHLPLDAHPELGNNAQLAQRAGSDRHRHRWRRRPHAGAGDAGRTGRHPSVEKPSPPTSPPGSVGTPLHIPGNDAPIRRLAWCTGAAQSSIEVALNEGADAFLTGEASEQTVHFARENGLHFFAAGHHATERHGVRALGAHLARQFALQFTFIDIDQPGLSAESSRLAAAIITALSDKHIDPNTRREV